MNSTTLKNETFCHELPISVVNTTFCGLTKEWNPRIHHAVLLLMVILPATIYWLVVLTSLRRIYGIAKNIWKNHLQAEVEDNILLETEGNIPQEDEDNILEKVGNNSLEELEDNSLREVGDNGL